MKVLLLTPIYPGPDIPYDTPVVHFFTREWVKMGYDVYVIHYIVNFPRIVHLLSRPIHDYLESKYASVVRLKQVEDAEYTEEGVKVRRIPLLKLKPHARYSKEQIRKAYNKTIKYCEEKGLVPDVIISHWVNPQYEIMNMLKEHFNAPTCFVCHDVGSDLLTIFKDEASDYIKNTNVIGYRSDYIKKVFEKRFEIKVPTFMCYSGIPSHFVDDKQGSQRTFDAIRSFIYVGTLVERKYPATILSALKKSYGEEGFIVSYIGDGNEMKEIEKAKSLLNNHQKVNVYGKQNRNFVADQLCNHDVFVMISKNETFGLVYLEAMAKGCITIASRNEGFDGIIKHGENGFLCEAGNSEELADIISMLRKMSPDELKKVSLSAIKTAQMLTDKKVAKYYIESVQKACNLL